MTEMTSYEPGTPCWVDLATPDQDAASEFYGAVFGWEVREDENAEQTGGYRTAQLGGGAVAGIMRIMQEGQHPAWTTYICVADADAIVARAREAGGNVLVEPMSVLDYGRMALLADPTGAVVGLWQPGTMVGADRVNEPGAFCWSELDTRDPDAARTFYGGVFGWGFDAREYEGMGTYTTIQVGDRGVGGIFDMTGRVPEEVPPNWLVYFAVEDADTAVATLRERGGTVVMELVELTGVGRFAVAQDPWGATFAILEPSPEMTDG